MMFDTRAYITVRGNEVEVDIDLGKKLGLWVEGPKAGEELELTDEQFHEAWDKYMETLSYMTEEQWLDHKAHVRMEEEED